MLTDCRDETVQAMEAYLNRHFRKGTSQFSAFADESQIRVEISCHNFNFKNFWGGEFLSSWVVDLQGDSMQGQVKIHNHYFEQGNIQFNMNKNFGPFQLKTVTGKSIVDQISKHETEVISIQNNLSQSIKKGWRTCTLKFLRNS